MNNMYDEILEKLTNIVIIQLDVDPKYVTLNANFINDLDADELDYPELMMAIEEAFEIEISDEEAERLLTVESVLDFLLHKIYGLPLRRIRATQIFKFLNTKYLNQEIVLKLFKNDDIISNWEIISEFVKVVDRKSFTISEIARYSFIFQNNFIISNIENIYKIVIFIEQNKIWRC